MAPIPIAYSRLAQADDEEAAIRLSMTDDDDKNPSDAPPAYTDDEDAAAPGQSAYKPTTGLAPKLVDDRSSAFKQCMAGGICGLIMVALYFSFLSGGGDWSSMLSNQLFGAGRPCAAHQATTNYAHAIETNARLGNLLSGNEVATEGIDLGRFAKIFERMFLAEPTAEGAREALRRYTNV